MEIIKCSDIICLYAVVLMDGTTMDHLYGNRRKFASFLLTGQALYWL